MFFIHKLGIDCLKIDQEKVFFLALLKNVCNFSFVNFSHFRDPKNNSEFYDPKKVQMTDPKKHSCSNSRPEKVP